MKKVLLFLFATVMFVSCSTSSYVQIVDVKSSVPVENDNFVYSDGTCRFTYYLWHVGGDAGFWVENLSEQTIYIDLSNSFFIKNGAAYDYFRNRTFGKGSSSSVASSVSGSVSAHGIWSLSSLAGTKSLSVSEAGTSASSYSVEIAEKEIIAIPPHSYKSISEYTIASDVIEDCSVRLFPKKKAPESMKFTESNTPIRFTNYITYKIGENGNSKVITHDFYVSGYTNYSSKDVVEKEKIGCKSMHIYEFNKYANGTKYFITYGKTHSNRFSADAVPFETHSSSKIDY